MLILKINRHSKVPVYRQLISILIERLEKGILRPGYRMPATRMLAETHGISRSTVIKVYEELWALGYLTSRPGSYSIVRKRKKRAVRDGKTPEALINWEEHSSPAALSLYNANEGLWSLSRQSEDRDVIKMSGLSLDPELFPAEAFRKTLNRIMLEKREDIFNFTDPRGYLPLREFIARRMQTHGISVSAEEVMITGGSQQGLNLVTMLLANGQKPVYTEDPTYFMFPPLLQSRNIVQRGIKMNSDGMDIDQLESLMKQESPAFLYTIPNAQNPTGITTSHEKRERILALCEANRCPIIEDAFEEEMKYFGKVPLPIKAMDRHQLVIYLSSFSKVFYPGLRIGWIAAEKGCIDRLVPLKIFSDISSNLPVQAALAEFGNSGAYDLHIKRIHRVFRKRMAAALNALEKHLNFKECRWTSPSGGFIVWITMRDTGKSDDDIFQILLDNGVRVFPGRYSFSGQPKLNHFRISISNLSETEMLEGISRIGQGIRQVYQATSI